MNPLPKGKIAFAIACIFVLLPPGASAPGGTFLMTSDPLSSSGLSVSHNNAAAIAEGHTVTEARLANIVTMSVNDLLAYDVIWINPPIINNILNNNTEIYYNNLRSGVANGGPLEQYAAGGGVLVICTAGTIGDQANIAPGGVDYDKSFHNAEIFTSPSHPYLTGAGYNGFSLSVTEFDNWNSTDHGRLTSLPGGATVVLSNSDGTSWAEYSWGNGTVMVTTLTYGFTNDLPHTGPVSINLINYAAGFGPQLLGDLNGDGIHDILDLRLSAQNWLVNCLTSPDNPACQALPVTASGPTQNTVSCDYFLAGDWNSDCANNLLDFALASQTWLIDCNATPDDPACQ